MQPKKKWRNLNRLYIKGKVKNGFFRKSKDFELVIFFTGLKKLIVDVQSDDISITDRNLNIDFGIGDHIDKAREWCNKNGHEIDHEINRFLY